jgi:predicted MFS family arabinose efflux permease
LKEDSAIVVQLMAWLLILFYGAAGVLGNITGGKYCKNTTTKNES